MTEQFNGVLWCKQQSNVTILMTEQFNGVLWCKQQSNVTDVLEKLYEVDKCVSQIDLRKRRARQALITDIF